MAWRWGSGGLMGKQSLYGHSTRAPLIFAGPGVPRGRSAALVHLHDIYPTICDLVGADPAGGAAEPAALDGVSLAPVIAGETDAVRDALFGSYLGVQRSVRDGRWKLLRYPKIGVTRLYDLAADPLERVDLSEDPAQADRIAALTARLRAFQAEYGDPLDLDAAPQQEPAFTPPSAERLEVLRAPWKGRS